MCSVGLFYLVTLVFFFFGGVPYVTADWSESQTLAIRTSSPHLLFLECMFCSSFSLQELFQEHRLKRVKSCWDRLILNHSPMWSKIKGWDAKFCSKYRVIFKATKQGNGRTILKSPWMQGAWGTSEMLHWFLCPGTLKKTLAIFKKIFLYSVFLEFYHFQFGYLGIILQFT